MIFTNPRKMSCWLFAGPSLLLGWEADTWGKNLGLQDIQIAEADSAFAARTARTEGGVKEHSDTKDQAMF